MNINILKYKKIILIGIILLAAILRLYQLGNVPPSPDWDEAALSYNGYSILTTGKDEYGEFLPVVLRSFDDYKPALYTYLTIPFTLLFDMNTFSVRLPSAIFGIATVLFVYLLIKELFRNEKLALLTAFLLAISPWHIQFSRIAFETNVGLAFNIMTAYFFIKGLKKPWLLSLSAVLAALAIYTYQSEKVFTPLFVAILIIIYLKDLLKLPKKYLAVAIVTGLLVIAPMANYITTNKNSLMRATATLAFSDQSTFLQKNVLRVEQDKRTNNYIGQVFDNRRVSYLFAGISGYFAHFNLNWLFIRGDNPRHHAPGMGILYLLELPLLLFGIYAFITRKFSLSDKKGKYFIIAWFLLAPVPAAFTSGVPHAIRTLNFLPTFQVFTAFGILSLLPFIMVKRARVISLAVYGLLLLFSLFAVFNFVYYLNQYFVQQNRFYSRDWQYGHKQAIEYIQQVESKYKKIVVSDREPLDQSYMFYLFHLKYSPTKYQSEAGSKSGGFDVRHKYGKYEFRPIDWTNETKSTDILYIGRPQDFSGEVKVKKSIDYLDGTPAIKIVEG